MSKKSAPASTPDHDPELTAAFVALNRAMRNIQLAAARTLATAANAYLVGLPGGAQLFLDDQTPDEPATFTISPEPDLSIRLVDHEGCVWYVVSVRESMYGTGRIANWACDLDRTPAAVQTKRRFTWAGLLQARGELRVWQSE